MRSPDAAGAEGPPHIVLVGIPGSGKTTVGRITAGLLGCGFMDFDEEIELRTGKSVAEIFQDHGEEGFREMERELTAEASLLPGQVLSPGGGWITDPGNVSLLRPPARLVHLAVPVSVALARLGPGLRRRPLLAGPDPEAALAALAARRNPLYGSADSVLDTQMLEPQAIAREVVRLASAWGWPIG